MGNFKTWLILDESFIGYVIAGLSRVIPENHPCLMEKANPNQMSMFPDEIWKPKKPEIKQACPLTPLSGYEKHIKSIQNFARSGPDQFAQVMMFSPLSAHAPFPKHWDNFQVLMTILKHYFPTNVDKEKLMHVIFGFDDYLHTLSHTINGFKLDTICQIWNNRESLYNELNNLAKEGDDVKLISRLTQIKGVRPVKAGFMVQLLWGRAGCVDVHNVAIYKKVFPDLADEINPKIWDKDDVGPEKYVNFLKKMGDRRIKTKEMWDVWVDFVENMTTMISKHGLGNYAYMGPSMNPAEDKYSALRGHEIDKIKVGRGADTVSVPIASGKYGIGASATHLQNDPDEMLKQFHKIYTKKEKGSEAANAIPFHVDNKGNPLDPMSGLGRAPSSLHYFQPAVDDKGEVDPDRIKHIIQSRIPKGQKAVQRGAAIRAARDAQTNLPY